MSENPAAADVQPVASNAGVAEFIFWFSVVGAGIAAIKHVAQPAAVMKDLTPVSVRGSPNDANSKTKEHISPEALWWGCYAFSAMNTGFFVNGMWAGYTQSREAKQGALLSCGVLFECFAFAWFTKGSITGKKDFQKQGAKIASLGAIFLYGFWLMLNNE